MTDTARTGDSEGRDMDDPAEKPAPRVGRRKMILGVAAAGVGASVVAGAGPAGATDGNPVLLGEANTAKATTSVTTKKGIGLEGSTSAEDQSGVQGVDTSTGGGFGVYGTSAVGTGVYGTITGDTSGHFAIQGADESTGEGGGAGVYGSSTNGMGVYGTSINHMGVFGIHSSGAGTGVVGVDASGNGRSHGVYGSSGSGYGVYGSSGSGYGVHGSSTDGTGVYGHSYAQDLFGVYGYATGDGGVGVQGVANGTNGIGVFAESTDGTSLLVSGDAQVNGNLSKSSGSFKIDHPLDPGGKYLYHSFVESPDMMNVYNGTVTLDGEGRATVVLPDWFEALNRDYRYQLTALDQPAPNAHISSRVKDGKFSIGGGNAGQEVSWQVTGIRQDAWANANRIPVEVDKKAEDQGRYLHPELFGGEAITALAKARKRVHRGQHTKPS